MEEVLAIEGIEGIENVWSVGVAGSARLLCSTAESSFLVQLEPKVEVLPLDQRVSHTAVLAASSIVTNGPTEAVVTINTAGVLLWDDISAGHECGTWTGDGRDIVAAQIHDGLAVVALQGGIVKVLDFADVTNIDVDINS